MNLTRKALVSLVAAGALLAPTLTKVEAQEPAPPPAQASEAPANAVSLALQDCLERALQNNLDLRVVRLNPDVARFGVTFQKAAFDPVLSANAQYGSTPSSGTQDVTNFDPTAIPAVTSGSLKIDDKNTNQQYSVGIAQTLSFGAQYSVELRRNDSVSDSSGFDPATRILSTSNNRFPTWGLGASFTLPLLKGFGKEVNTVGILIAENDVKISEEDLRQNAEATVKGTVDAYWNVTAARAAVKVAKQSLKLAQDLYDLNKKKVEVGTLAPIEITQAEAGVASREEGVIVAENTLQNTQDALRQILAVPKDDPLWNEDILTSDRPSSEPVAIDLGAAVATALEHRPEMRSARLRQDSQELSERVAKKNTRHQLDLVFTAASSRSKPELEYEYFDSTGSLIGSNSTASDLKGEPVWTAALRYTYPVANRAAKANYATALANREQADLALESTEQNIRVDVRVAARAVESGAKRVAAAKANTELQQKNVDAETKKFENGMSTSFEVLNIQTDLTNAQLAEIQAVLDYNKALVDLERAKGTLLEAKGLKLDDTAGR